MVFWSKLYLRQTRAPILCAAVATLLINGILIFSRPLSVTHGELLYMNVLLGMLYSTALIIGFIRFYSRFCALHKALQAKSDLPGVLPDDGRPESYFLRGVVSALQARHQQSLSRAERQTGELREYISLWVHEIKIPLAVCELMLNRPEAAPLRPGMELELARLRFLVNQVLFAEKATHYSADLRAETVELVRSAREAVRRASVPLRARNIEVAITLPPLSAHADPVWLGYILDQLLNNAAKYTPQGGRIEIGGSDGERQVTLTVRDNGAGIPAQDIARIFEKGFTGENGRRFGKSTGMGLYYARNMAARLGIVLSVQSSPGDTCFTLRIPKFPEYLNVL